MVSDRRLLHSMPITAGLISPMGSDAPDINKSAQVQPQFVMTRKERKPPQSVNWGWQYLRV